MLPVFGSMYWYIGVGSKSPWYSLPADCSIQVLGSPGVVLASGPVVGVAPGFFAAYSALPVIPAIIAAGV